MEIISSTINRSFVYGDLVFETVRVSNGKVMYALDHYQRMLAGMQFLQFKAEGFTADAFASALHNEVKQKQLVHARIRITCIRGGEGFYTPQHDKAMWYIESTPVLPETKWCKTLGIYDEMKRPCHIISSLKTGNALVQVMAGKYSRSNGFDDCLVLNEKGTVACGISANVWYISKGVWYTTDINTGSVAGVMQHRIKNYCLVNHIPVVAGEISLSDLEHADEIFLSNAISKVIPVLEFNNRHYQSATGVKLFGLID